MTSDSESYFKIIYGLSSLELVKVIETATSDSSKSYSTVEPHRVKRSASKLITNAPSQEMSECKSEEVVMNEEKLQSIYSIISKYFSICLGICVPFRLGVE